MVRQVYYQSEADAAPVQMKFSFNSGHPAHPDIVCLHCVKGYRGWTMEKHCGYCSDTGREPLPFTEVWGI